MDLPLNPPDEVIESLLSKTTVSDELESVTSAAESDRSSQSAEERIKKWIEKKELFISLEREEDAKQTEQALAVLPIKVCKACSLSFLKSLHFFSFS